ncbi:hypothetical protein GH741_09285 [Aquibacillus halophilus]|uniref:Uncharacterized protein n=1 Tax=Aquibacillus halophilus TaxID=930132 RepID=A0A6A8DB88_9BACI|nr:hypothetical protein [Aquibacillus halophilus]MRH42878.1 hypothetical protein [Aquibacillus halophilus]
MGKEQSEDPATSGFSREEAEAFPMERECFTEAMGDQSSYKGWGTFMTKLRRIYHQVRRLKYYRSYENSLF